MSGQPEQRVCSVQESRRLGLCVWGGLGGVGVGVGAQEVGLDRLLLKTKATLHRHHLRMGIKLCSCHQEYTSP